MEQERHEVLHTIMMTVRMMAFRSRAEGFSNAEVMGAIQDGTHRGILDYKETQGLIDDLKRRFP